MKIPEYIKCPNCEEAIEMRKICSVCGAQVAALKNLHPEIFHETVFDKLNSKIEEILREVNNLKSALKDFKIRGLKLKSTRI